MSPRSLPLAASIALTLGLCGACTSVELAAAGDPGPSYAGEFTSSYPQLSTYPADRDPYGGVEYSDARVAGEFGTREYRNARWGSLDSPAVVGVTGSREPPEWPLGIDVGLFYVNDSGRLFGTPTDLDNWEGFAGLMKSFTLLNGWLILQAGAGGALNYAEADPDDPLTSSDDAFWSSAYARLGATLQFSKQFEFGVGVRSVRGGNFQLLDVSLDGDYDQIVFTLSASW